MSRNHSLLPALLAALLASATTGTAVHAADVAGPASQGTETFSHALSVCRFFHGGRASQRANLRPDEPALQACLQQRGWWADGTRTLASQSAAGR